MPIHKFLVLVLVASCADDSTAYESGVGSCASSGTPQPFCTEYDDASADELRLDAEVMCNDHQGIWTFDTCSRNLAVGGCRAEVTGPFGTFMTTSWYYGAMTEADVMATCSALGRTFVRP